MLLDVVRLFRLSVWCRSLAGDEACVRWWVVWGGGGAGLLAWRSPIYQEKLAAQLRAGAVYIYAWVFYI